MTNNVLRLLDKMAESDFEVKRFSKPPPSATRPQLHRADPYRIWDSASNLDTSKRPIRHLTTDPVDTFLDTPSRQRVWTSSAGVLPHPFQHGRAG